MGYEQLLSDLALSHHFQIHREGNLSPDCLLPGGKQSPVWVAVRVQKVYIHKIGFNWFFQCIVYAM